MPQSTPVSISNVTLNSDVIVDFIEDQSQARFISYKISNSSVDKIWLTSAIGGQINVDAWHSVVTFYIPDFKQHFIEFYGVSGVSG